MTQTDTTVSIIALALHLGTCLYFTKKVQDTRNDANAEQIYFPENTDPDPNVKWETFGFGLNADVDFMWLDRIIPGDSNSDAYSSDHRDCLKAVGALSLHPASTVLNYGQSLFEGLKAFRRSDGSIAIFRPDRNAKRIASGALRLLIPPIPEDIFLKACHDLVRANAQWVPPYGNGALYLRPLLFGSGAALGVKPSIEYTFCIYCSPVGDYFKKAGGPRPIQLQAVRSYSRAAPGGVGSVKAAGNYAPCFLVQKEVRARGYDEALFVDCTTGDGLEEAGASNIFAVFPDKKIVTPCLGTILPGITRESIIELAEKEFGCIVEQRRLTLSELESATEAFCCGTGASITPVGRINIYEEDATTSKDIIFGDGESMGSLTRNIRDLLLSIQMGTASEKKQDSYSAWIHIVA